MAFTMNCTVDNNRVTFIMFSAKNIIINVRTEDGKYHSGCTPESEAAMIASRLVDVDLWPAFANPLKPSYAANKLFG